MLAGLADSTLTRDEGWSFLVLGRNLERVDMTARLLSARYAETWGPTVWATTLRCCSGVRGVPAHLPARRRRVVGARVPAARPAVPAFGAPRARPRRSARSASSTPVPAGPASTTTRAASSAAATPSSASCASSDAAADLPELLEYAAGRDRRRPPRGHTAATSSTPRRSRGARDGQAGGMRVRHHTGFQYEKDVHASYNEARLTPARHGDAAGRPSTGSTCSPAPRSRGTATTGARLGALVRPQPSRTASSGVGLLGRGDRDSGTARRLRSRGPTCARTRCRTRGASTSSTTLVHRARRPGPRAWPSSSPARRRRGTRSRASSAWIHEGMEYEKGSTTVTTTAPEALQARHGVCQDFAHLGLALVRTPRHPGAVHVGLPAPRRRGRSDRRGHRGREPRVDRGLARRVDAARPDERRPRRTPPRRRGARPRLRRRPAAQGRLPRRPRRALDVKVELTRLA